MATSLKSLVSGIWIGSLITFAVTAFYLVSNEQNINVPGEMSEALGGVGIPLFGFFSIMTLIMMVIPQKKKS